jgi:hypothetical protein
MIINPTIGSAVIASIPGFVGYVGHISRIVLKRPGETQIWVEFPRKAWSVPTATFMFRPDELTAVERD